MATSIRESVLRVDVLEYGVDAWLHVRPEAHVLVLLLHPLYVRIWELLHLCLHQVKRERGQLLHPSDGDVAVEMLHGPLLHQLVVDLARAEDEFLHVLRVVYRLLVILRDEAFEL